jgi:glutamine synthetase
MNIPETFGKLVFNDAAMRGCLPEDTYKVLKRVISGSSRLEPDIANAVADAMMHWAVENGATHFTHWFQPMTGITAEKHDSFIAAAGGGKVIMEFSGKELVKGEPDASSFPSGGLRAAFEARGYTAWDPTSYAFIKDGTLCIPTAFCSHGGDALDKKTPLLRSMQAIDLQARRILKLFNNTAVTRVVPMVGAEQEYFLIDRSVYLQRPDLIHCGRTLFGAQPPKGQDLDDYYYGAIKPRVSAFMKDAEAELWKLGVYAKTRHNESAPAQHELACIYNTVNVTTDHNQLTMELLRHVAGRHDLVCLLHEKPFHGVNGSGKHINWSLSTDGGVNLFEPGDTPYDNAQFLLFLVAVIQAVDEYQDLLRLSVASAGNDHRLGENEAPPAIISIFLGDELTAILHALEQGEDYRSGGPMQMEIGVNALPRFPREMTDRNRTSPFAFTGNKFEFRMPGSSLSTAGPCFVLNTIVAEVLCRYADRLEKEPDFWGDMQSLIKQAIRQHKRIIFNGNSYSPEWEAEAKTRGLSNLKTAVDAIPCYIHSKNMIVLVNHHILTEQEIRSRYEILLENYSRTIRIEALTMLEMTRKDILPGAAAYQNLLAQLICNKKAAGGYWATTESIILKRLSELSLFAWETVNELENDLQTIHTEPLERARFTRYTVFTNMNALRKAVDEMETLTGRDYWPFPSYGGILNSVN